MNEGGLVAIYLAIGLALGGAIYFRAAERNARTAASAITCVALWPLWAPFALASSPLSVGRGPLATRIANALEDARRATAGTPAARAWRDDTAQLMRRVRAAERRFMELDLRIASMKPKDEPPAESNVRAQLRATSLAQLESLRDREHLALLELAELCELLRTQLVLARFGGSDRVEELRDELWARVQALSEVG